MNNAAGRILIAAALGLSCLLEVACSDAPTSPPSNLRPGPYSADRSEPTFTIDTIDIPGALATSPQGINASGDVSGTYLDVTGRSHGFILHNGAITTIDFPGADNTDAHGIGPSGDIVGTHWNNGEEAVASHGYHRTIQGQFEDVHFPGHLYEIPQRILPDGRILGCRHDHDLMGSMRGIIITSTDSTETDMFASMNNGATPDGSMVVGLYTNMMTTPSRTEAYVIANGEITPFVVPGSSLTTAWDVNPRGDIVGVFRDVRGLHGYVRTDAGYTTISVPGASATRAFGINARGDVIGTFVSGGATHGFLAVRMH